jgi:GNAT superfamily N-acetyltransferase
MNSSTDTAAGDLRVCVEAQACSSDVAWLNARLYEFNARAAGGNDFLPVQIFLRDSSGGLHGGLLGWTLWSWLHIDALWVNEDQRGQGHGLRLIAAAERAARMRGCTLAEVDTFSFQARGFYERAGYTVFGTLPGIGGRFERYYLSRELT